jgi:hypothetical protein
MGAQLTLLSSCGPRLLLLYIHDPHSSSSTDPYSDDASLTADKVAMVARLLHLVRLHTDEIRILDIWERSTANERAAIAQLLGGIGDPFPALCELITQMYASTMPLVLPFVGRLTTLQVKVERAQGFNVLPAIVESVPLLQVLRLRLKYELHKRNATGPDILVLRHLRHLRVLEVGSMFDNAGGQSLSSAEWVEFVAQLPLLECLRMPHSLCLPADALRVLGEGCCRLFDVSLRDECDIEVLDDGPEATPCFPNLSKLKIACFGHRGDGERYITLGAPAPPQLHLLAHCPAAKLLRLMDGY